MNLHCHRSLEFVQLTHAEAQELTENSMNPKQKWEDCFNPSTPWLNYSDHMSLVPRIFTVPLILLLRDLKTCTDYLGRQTLNNKDTNIIKMISSMMNGKKECYQRESVDVELSLRSDIYMNM